MQVHGDFPIYNLFRAERDIHRHISTYGLHKDPLERILITTDNPTCIGSLTVNNNFDSGVTFFKTVTMKVTVLYDEISKIYKRDARDIDE
jgi:hypothetical protein